MGRIIDSEAHAWVRIPNNWRHRSSPDERRSSLNPRSAASYRPSRPAPDGAFVMSEDTSDELLAAIYGLTARDEIAHFGFYVAVARVLLEEDAEGTKRDLAHVFKHFKMPAYDLVPDYDDRVVVMRTAGMDRGAFVREIWLPVLKAIGVTRAELVGLERSTHAV